MFHLSHLKWQNVKELSRGPECRFEKKHFVTLVGLCMQTGTIFIDAHNAYICSSKPVFEKVESLFSCLNAKSYRLRRCRRSFTMEMNCKEGEPFVGALLGKGLLYPPLTTTTFKEEEKTQKG